LLVVLAIAPPSLVLAPVVAAVAHTVVPTYFTSPDIGAWQQMIFGVVAILIIISADAAEERLERLAGAGTRTAWRRQRSPVAARRISGRERSIAPAVLAEAQN
jgi:hypothetical protein